MEKKTTTMSEKKTTSKKTAAKKMPVMPTLLQAIERVVEMSKGSCLSERFMTEAAPEIQFLSESFGITDVQAVLFCICMERGPRNVDYNDFACHLDLSKIRLNAVGLGVKHRLHSNRRSPANWHVANHDLMCVLIRFHDSPVLDSLIVRQTKEAQRISLFDCIFL